jgi:hypothetical protein
MEITTINNFFPDDLANTLLVESDQYEWEFCRSDYNEDIYWTKFIYGWSLNSSTKENIFLKEFTKPTIEKAWDFFSGKFNVPKENLCSVYLNGLTYGIEAHLHVDSNQSDAVTVICYICPEWNSFWSGATSFYDGSFSKDPTSRIFYTQDIQKTILPKYNRIVVFSSNIIHSVHPISKNYKGLRKTLMFKLKNIEYKDLMTGANYGNT